MLRLECRFIAVRPQYCCRGLALLLFLCALSPGAAAQTQFPPKFRLIDLGPFSPKPESEARAINNQGLIVGLSFSPLNSAQVAVEWRVDSRTGVVTATTLPDLPGAVHGSSAYAINNAGQIVGQAFLRNGAELPIDERAVLWDASGNVFDLQIPPSPAQPSYFAHGNAAEAINDTGQVVGIRVHGSGWLWQNGTVSIFSPVPSVSPSECDQFGICGYFGPQAINASGRVVGTAYNVFGEQAFLTDSLGAIYTWLGWFAGNSPVTPNGINNAGDIVGSARRCPHYCNELAFLWRGGQLIDLGALQPGFGARAYAVNNSGQIVGTGDGTPGTVEETYGTALLWRNGKVFDLNTLIPAGAGLVLAQARGINDNGQIIGYGYPLPLDPNENDMEHAFVLIPDPCNDAGGDTDGDGLCDDWEKNGLTVDVNGTPVFLDLPAVGADPNHKDIFVQLDSMTGHQLAQPQIDAIVAAFANSPVSTNPDGRLGITLHVDNGPNSTMDPKTGATWGMLSRAHNTIAVSTIGQIQADNSYDWTAFFDPIKDAQFDPARKPVFHYALSVAGNIPDLSRGLDSNGLPQGAAGLSRGGYPVGGSDFMVALEVNPPAWAASGVFMHELGHNLGLSHGGDLEPDETEINRKPNYLSVMNYALLAGIPKQGGPVDDYSRFGPFDLAVLFESHLSETASFALANNSPLTAYSTVRYCANTMTWTMSPLAGPQDWDCNGTISAFVESADINGDGKITRLAPYDDWAHLVYDGGQIGKTAAAVLPAVSHQQEPTMQDLLETAPLIIQTDMSPPTTTATISPSANASGWNNSNVTVTLSSTDNEPGGSGVKQITYSATGAQTIASTVVNAASASIVITTEGTTTITFFGTDNAGNVETANTLTVKLDKTPPSISGTRTPAPNANGWNNTNVAVSLVCSDSLSGLARGSPPAPMTFTSEGAGQSVTGTCTDVAGNSASAAVNGINIDKTPPMLACTASPNVLWPPNNKLVPVNVSVTVSDVLSGPSGFTLVSVSSNEPDSGQGDIQGFVTGTASTAGQLRAQRLGSGTGRVYTFTYSDADRAGNTASCTATVSVPHDQGN